MTDHTPEPWEGRHCPNMPADPLKYAAIHGGREVARVWRLEDLDRIVACVNACAGIPTEQLQQGGVADLVLVLQGILDEPDNDMTLDSLEAARDAFAPFRKD